MKILITAGATCEPIDDVRYLTNVSTGRTGTILAEMLAELGNTVFLLHSMSATSLPAESPNIATHCFSSTADLQQQLQTQLSSGYYHAVIQCAAVSDYRPITQHQGKLSSDAKELTIHLEPTPKLIPLLKGYSPKPVFVVGFKLTSNASPEETKEAVKKLFASGDIDLVIHNDLKDRDMRGDNRPFNIYSKNEEFVVIHGVRKLVDFLNKKLSQATLAQSG